MSQWRPVRFSDSRGERCWGVYRSGAEGGWLTGARDQLLMFTKAGAQRRADDLNAAAVVSAPSTRDVGEQR